MEPQIRYVRREDGARTAYGVMGSGPVLLIPPGFLSNLEWTLRPSEERRLFWDVLAEHHTLVLYDRHGCGLSDRRRTEFTAEDDMQDIYAVVGALGESALDVFGISFGGSVAVRYAAEQSAHVRRMVLWGTTASHDRATFPAEIRARMDALSALRRTDFNLAMRTAASQMFPSGIDAETFRNFVRLNVESTTVEILEGFDAVAFDNRSLLAKVEAPALVLHRRGDQMVPFAVGQYLARRLPNAVFVPLEGDAHLPQYGDVESILHPIVEFLAEGSPNPSPIPAAEWEPNSLLRPSGTAIILFTDIADSTSLTERMGDVLFRNAARALDEKERAAIREAGGVPVEGKVLGDGVMAVFTSATQALDAARRCVALSAGSGLALHIGLHAGDVIHEENNVYGGAVNIASRICGLSAPGEILVSATIRELARTSTGAIFEDRGEHALKGVDDPVRIYAVRG